MVGQARRLVASVVCAPVVEQHAARVAVVELRLLLAIDCRYLYGAFLQSFGNGEGEVTDVKLIDGNGLAVDSQRERRVGVVDEIVTIDGDLLTTRCPLIAHTVDVRAGYQHLEVVGGGIVGIVNHEDFVEHLIGNLPRYGDNHRVVGDEAWDELGLLVVEKHLGDAAQVLAHDTDVVVHIGAGQDGVGTLNIHRAYIADNRCTTADLILVRLVFASCEAYHGEGSHGQA